MKYLCKFSIITHASAMAHSSTITYIVGNQKKNIAQQYTLLYLENTGIL